MVFTVTVPKVAGVPNVNFSASVIATPVLLTADFQAGLGGISVGLSFGLSGLFSQKWGIYSNGAPVVVADTVTSLDFKREWSLSDYPVEQGGFETYDKVALPYDARIRFIAGDNQSNRRALLNSIAAIAGDMNLYTVVTPEATYPSMNVTHYDYKRTTRNGVGLLQVDVWCLEVRQAVATIGASTAQPDAAEQVNNGAVQTTTPTETQKAAVQSSEVMIA